MGAAFGRPPSFPATGERQGVLDYRNACDYGSRIKDALDRIRPILSEMENMVGSSDFTPDARSAMIRLAYGIESLDISHNHLWLEVKRHQDEMNARQERLAGVAA